jgi:hypothetical protein
MTSQRVSNRSDSVLEQAFNTDVHWMADLEDHRTNPNFQRNLWLMFRCPTLRHTISKRELAKYEEKFDRCRHIDAKWDKMRAEIRANRRHRTHKRRTQGDRGKSGSRYRVIP